ncbi:MAG: hypothetical protein IPH29_01955 [Candidatus Microthrix sp.]|nr:hypothetical protein [Candidatus Microthrix sp.]
MSSLTTGFFPLDIWRNVLAIIIITDNTFHVKQKSIKNNMTKEEIFLSEFSFKARDVTLCRLSVTSKNLQKVVHDEMLNHEYNQKNHYNKFLENKERLFLVDALEDVYWMEKSLKTKWIYAIDPLKSEIGLETLFSYLEYFDDTKRAALKIFGQKWKIRHFLTMDLLEAFLQSLTMER